MWGCNSQRGVPEDDMVRAVFLSQKNWRNFFYTCLVMSSTKNSTGALMSPFFQEIMENVTKTARSVAASIWALKKCTESLYQCFVCNNFMTGFDKSSGLFLEATTRASECCSPAKLPEQQGLEEAAGIQGCKKYIGSK